MHVVRESAGVVGTPHAMKKSRRVEMRRLESA